MADAADGNANNQAEGSNANNQAEGNNANSHAEDYDALDQADIDMELLAGLPPQPTIVPTILPEGRERVHQLLSAQFGADKVAQFDAALQEHRAILFGNFVLRALTDHLQTDVDRQTVTADVSHENWAENHDVDIAVPVAYTTGALNVFARAPDALFRRLGESFFFTTTGASHDKETFMRRAGVKRSYTVVNALDFPTSKDNILIVRESSTVQCVASALEFTFLQVWYDGVNVYANYPDDVRGRSGFLTPYYIPPFMVGYPCIRYRAQRYIRHGFNLDYDPALDRPEESEPRPPAEDVAFYPHDNADEAMCEDLVDEVEKLRSWRKRVAMKQVLGVKNRKSGESFYYVAPNELPTQTKDDGICLHEYQFFDRLVYYSNNMKPIDEFFPSPEEGHDSETADVFALAQALPQTPTDLVAAHEDGRLKYHREMAKFYFATFFMEEPRAPRAGVAPGPFPYNMKQLLHYYETKGSTPGIEKIYDYQRVIMGHGLRFGRDMYEKVGLLYDIHEHPADAGITREGLEQYLAQYLQRTDKSQIPCYWTPDIQDPGKPIPPTNCRHSLTRSEILMIVGPSFWRKWSAETPIRTGLSETVDMYTPALANVKTLDPKFGDIFHDTMCPFCLQPLIRQQGCAYMAHEKRAGENYPYCDPKFVVKELIDKYTTAATRLGASPQLECCVECGRPSNGHEHFSLDGASLIKPPELPPERRTYYRFDYGACSSPNKRAELIARMLAVRDTYANFELRDPKEERKAAALAAEKAAGDEAYLTRARKILESEPANRAWNAPVPLSKRYTTPEYEGSKNALPTAPNAPAPNAPAPNAPVAGAGDSRRKPGAREYGSDEKEPEEEEYNTDMTRGDEATGKFDILVGSVYIIIDDETGETQKVRVTQIRPRNDGNRWEMDVDVLVGAGAGGSRTVGSSEVAWYFTTQRPKIPEEREMVEGERITTDPAYWSTRIHGPPVLFRSGGILYEGALEAIRPAPHGPIPAELRFRVFTYSPGGENNYVRIIPLNSQTELYGKPGNPVNAPYEAGAAGAEAVPVAAPAKQYGELIDPLFHIVVGGTYVAQPTANPSQFITLTVNRIEPHADEIYIYHGTSADGTVHALPQETHIWYTTIAPAPGHPEEADYEADIPKGKSYDDQVQTYKPLQGFLRLGKTYVFDYYGSSFAGVLDAITPLGKRVTDPLTVPLPVLRFRLTQVTAAPPASVVYVPLDNSTEVYVIAGEALDEYQDIASLEPSQKKIDASDYLKGPAFTLDITKNYAMQQFAPLLYIEPIGGGGIYIVRRFAEIKEEGVWVEGEPRPEFLESWKYRFYFALPRRGEEVPYSSLVPNNEYLYQNKGYPGGELMKFVGIAGTTGIILSYKGEIRLANLANYTFYAVVWPPRKMTLREFLNMLRTIEPKRVPSTVGTGIALDPTPFNDVVVGGLYSIYVDGRHTNHIIVKYKDDDFFGYLGKFGSDVALRREEAERMQYFRILPIEELYEALKERGRAYIAANPYEFIDEEWKRTMNQVHDFFNVGEVYVYERPDGSNVRARLVFNHKNFYYVFQLEDGEFYIHKAAAGVATPIYLYAPFSKLSGLGQAQFLVEKRMKDANYVPGPNNAKGDEVKFGDLELNKEYLYLTDKGVLAKGLLLSTVKKEGNRDEWAGFINASTRKPDIAGPASRYWVPAEGLAGNAVPAGLPGARGLGGAGAGLVRQPGDNFFHNIVPAPAAPQDLFVAAGLGGDQALAAANQWAIDHPWVPLVNVQPGPLRGIKPSNIGGEYYYTPFIERPAIQVRVVHRAGNRLFLQGFQDRRVFEADDVAFYRALIPQPAAALAAAGPGAQNPRAPPAAPAPNAQEGGRRRTTYRKRRTNKRKSLRAKRKSSH